MARKSPESSQAEQLLINFPPEGMPTGRARAIADYSLRQRDTPSVTVTGKWDTTFGEMLKREVDENTEERRQRGAS